MNFRSDGPQACARELIWGLAHVSSCHPMADITHEFDLASASVAFLDLARAKTILPADEVAPHRSSK